MPALARGPLVFDRLGWVKIRPAATPGRGMSWRTSATVGQCPEPLPLASDVCCRLGLGRRLAAGNGSALEGTASCMPAYASACQHARAIRVRRCGGGGGCGGLAGRGTASSVPGPGSEGGSGAGAGARARALWLASCRTKPSTPQRSRERRGTRPSRSVTRSGVRPWRRVGCGILTTSLGRWPRS